MLGKALLDCLQNTILFSYGIPPARVKKQITGKGNATKEDVAKALPAFVGDVEYGAHSICKSLNDRGIRSKTGNYWRATTLRSLVANEANLGYVKCKGVLYGPFEHLRVIDDYYFTKANDMIHARAPKHKKDFNGSTFSNGCQHGLLKGLVFCGECGGRMTIAKNRSKRYRADGTPVVYETNLYRCYKKLVSSEHKGKTGYKAEPLEEHVLAIVRNFFSKIKHTPNDEMLNAASQRDASIQHLAFERAEKAYKKAEDDLMKLKQEAIKSITGDGKLSLDVIDGLIKSQESTLQSTREVYENAKREVEALEDKANLREAEVEHLMSWADAFDSCTIEQKRTIIAALVDKVTLKGDNIEVEMTLHAEQFLQSAS